MNNTFRYTLVPVILGTGLSARLLADRWWIKFRVRSYVMGEKYHPLLLSPSVKFRRLSSSTGYSDFVLTDLSRVAQEHPDKLPVLVGTTPHYRALIRENSSVLERQFILADEALSFLDTEGITGGERV